MKLATTMVFLSAGAVLAGGCRSAPASTTAPSPPEGEVWLTTRQVQEAKVRVEPVLVRPVGNEVLTGGKVAFDDLRVAHVFSPVTGRIRRILADPGQRVKKGASLAAIESPDVGNAFADLDKAQADLIASDHELARQRELFANHATSERELEAAQDNARKARAEMERSRQKARLFRAGAVDAVTQEFTLRAPIDGEVIARNVNPGTEVQGQYSGATAVELFTIGELDRVWVVADVFEMDMGRVRKDAAVSVRVVAYPDRTFAGKVDWIGDTLDPASRTVRVRCSLPNPDRALKPEMYATVSIAVAGAPALTVPRTAVLRIAEQTMLFVAVGAAPDGRQRFARRIVAIDDDQGGAFVPVVRGVSPGDQVVAAGAILLSGML